MTGCIGKWAFALNGYGIKYLPRTTIKSQGLADVQADFSPEPQKIANDKLVGISNVNNDAWISFVNRLSNFHGAGLGVIQKSPQEDKIVQGIYCDFKVTNNEAK